MSTADQANRPPEVLAGEVVGGKWRVGALIGRGGMGAVYEGTNTSIGKKVALKFIDAEFARNVDIASRFQREAEAASLVESAHIVHIFDSGTTDAGLPYIVMELLRGEDLRGRINRLGRIACEEAVHIVAQTLRGLHRAHEAGIVHRDLKPDNVFLVDRDDDPLFAKIVDFGISKMMRRPGDPAGNAGTLTRQGVVLGTPFYMSPEQAQAFADLDLRTDLWSLGAILFECLGGRPPHTGDAYEQIIISICTTDAPDIRSLDPNVPAPLAQFVARALQRDRTLRFQTAKEMLQALQATGIGNVRTLGEQASGQRAPMSAAAAGSGASDAERAKGAPSGRTRVSWTAGGGRAAASDAESAGPDDPRGARAKGVRRRAILVLGAIVMGAAFLLTFSLLRSRGAGPAATVTPSPTSPVSPRATASTGASTAAALAAGTAPGAASSATDAPAAAASAEPRAAGSKSNPLPIAAGGKIRRGAPPAPAAPAPTPAAPSPAPAAAGSTRAGVAGGLQIKTSYP
ncbi:MAG TPA: serine/threonine-protein kinase [Polyangiaceae bacterium]|nr:serine/threonine-protein kinase [Polyangiaceae bacterium]